MNVKEMFGAFWDLFRMFCLVIVLLLFLSAILMGLGVI